MAQAKKNIVMDQTYQLRGGVYIRSVGLDAKRNSPMLVYYYELSKYKNGNIRGVMGSVFGPSPPTKRNRYVFTTPQVKGHTNVPKDHALVRTSQTDLLAGLFFPITELTDTITLAALNTNIPRKMGSAEYYLNKAWQYNIYNQITGGGSL